MPFGTIVRRELNRRVGTSTVPGIVGKRDFVMPLIEKEAIHWYDLYAPILIVVRYKWKSFDAMDEMKKEAAQLGPKEVAPIQVSVLP